MKRKKKSSRISSSIVTKKPSQTEDVTVPAPSPSPPGRKKPDAFYKITYAKKNKCRLEGGRKVTASRRRSDNVINQVAPHEVVNNEVDNIVNEVLVNLNVDSATEDQDKTGDKSPSMNEGDVDITSDGASDDGDSDVSVDYTSDDGDQSVGGTTDDENENSNSSTTDGDDDNDDGGWRLVRPVEGGPENISILTGYRGHVAYKIWKNEEREVLQSNTRFKILSSWKLPDGDAWVTKVKETGLSHLSACMFEHLNMALISAFVERWHPETNSFHMPFGEMSITLHDVAYILGLKIDGCVVYRGEMDGDKMKTSLARCLGVPLSRLSQRGEIMKGYAIKLATVKEVGQKLGDVAKARAYIFSLLGGFLFVDKTFDKSNGFIMPLLEDFSQISEYAWGTATLAYLYRQLGIASRSGTKGICGCLVLLEAWIYEYFPKIASRANIKYKENMPRACKWVSRSHDKGLDEVKNYRIAIDGMTADEIAWMPFSRNPHVDYPVSLFEGVIQCLGFVESYMPQRFIRQFGFVQGIPQDPLTPEKFSRPAEGSYVVEHPLMFSLYMWNKRHDVLLDTSKLRATMFSYETTSEYLSWFSKISPTYSKSLPSESSVTSSTSSLSAVKMARLRELLYSISEDRRPPGGFEDNDMYHFVVDECIKLINNS